MPRVTHEETDRVLACPDCDGAGDLYKRTGNGNAYVGDVEEPYRCQKCGATFSEPVDRPAKGVTGGAVTDEELLSDLKAVCDSLNGGVTRREYDELGNHAASTVIDRWGWNNAIKKVGYTPNKAMGGGGPAHGLKLQRMDPTDIGLSPVEESDTA